MDSPKPRIGIFSLFESSTSGKRCIGQTQNGFLPTGTLNAEASGVAKRPGFFGAVCDSKFTHRHP